MGRFVLSELGEDFVIDLLSGSVLFQCDEESGPIEINISELAHRNSTNWQLFSLLRLVFIRSS